MNNARPVIIALRTTMITIALCLSAATPILAQHENSDFFALLPIKPTDAPSACVTLPAATPTRCIASEDVEQDSIEFFQMHTSSATTNNFVIRFRYTEAGAKKMLAFRREQAGHEVLIQVGSFERLIRMATLQARPAGWIEEGWLKRRTDKFFGVTEEEAKAIVDGLKNK